MRTLLTIPVYNEVAHVRDVLGEVRRHVEDILVVDDGSTDGTAAVLAQIGGIRVIRHDRNKGYGQSIIDAFNCAKCCGFDWIITMDCDRQHEPASIPEFLAVIAADDCDIVSGSRYLLDEGDAALPPVDRRRINTEITTLLNHMLGLNITDAFCGFKAYRVSRLVELALTEAGYAMPVQLWVRAMRLGLRIREIPVRLIYNDTSRSFGGHLDDPDYRLRHYFNVLNRTLLEVGQATSGCCCFSGRGPGCQ
ncbi:MAG: glycosyltransferase family 2 protein [Planctomycetes bacterium]|nr:glycosyltransferase family 2 protein [Planctomycetota bacterium]